MTLAPLADGADLFARNITVPDSMDTATLLASASSAVRQAAGCAISQLTSTINIVAYELNELVLPFGPVTALASITLNSVPVTGWTLLDDMVLMPPGWTQVLPVKLTVTYTHGLPIVPADIVDLVCGMVSIAAAAGAADDAYGSGDRTNSIKLGDYAESFAVPPGTESPSPFALPQRTRDELRARFGASAVAVRVN